jgi:hypothetical protein
MAGLRGQMLTPSRLRLSSLCLGITVTISISQRNATSVGASPGCRGNAMAGFRSLCFLVRAERVQIWKTRCFKCLGFQGSLGQIACNHETLNDVPHLCSHMINCVINPQARCRHPYSSTASESTYIWQLVCVGKSLGL